MTQARLTIGIPTRNRAELVTQLVAACLNQTELPFQIIVSDNASDDDTLQRLTALSSPCLTVIRQEKNIGMVPNWNACLEAARGDWFVLISDDDMVDTDCVQSITALLDQYPAVDLAIIRCRIADEITREMKSNAPPSLHAGEVDFINCILPAWLNYKFSLPLAGMVFRTSALKASGGFAADWPYAADAATWLPIAMHGKCSFLPDAKLSYRVHNGMGTRATILNVLVADVARLTALTNQELAKRGDVDAAKRAAIKKMSDVYLRNMFGHVMITAARAGSPKREIFVTWWSWLNRLPGFGISPLSVGALLVPQSFIQSVGAPYRWWVRQRLAGKRPR